jgi:glycosyltransferase involved in cell wall biosynthesis
LTPVISTSIPILATVHTPMVVDSKKTELINFKSYIRRAMGLTASYYHERRLIKEAKIITVVSESVRQEVEDNFSFNAPLYVLGNAVDHQEYLPREGSKENIILFVGRFDLRKGIMDLMKCIRLFKEVGRTEQFILIGKGPLYNDVLKYKENHDLSNITLPGFVSKENLIRYYQTAKVYIMPSHYEGLPTVLLEAMSCGLPAVATNVSGNLDVIVHGNNGLMIPIESPSIMRDSLIQILDDKNLHLKLAKNARQTIENKYNWIKVGSQYYSLIKELTH